MKNTEKNNDAILPVGYLDIQSLAIPEGEDLKRQIAQLKEEKNSVIWVDHRADEAVCAWADCLVYSTDIKAVEPRANIIVFYGERKDASALKEIFPNHTLLFWEKHGESADFLRNISDAQRLFLCLKYELPVVEVESV